MTTQPLSTLKCYNLTSGAFAQITHKDINTYACNVTKFTLVFIAGWKNITQPNLQFSLRQQPNSSPTSISSSTPNSYLHITCKYLIVEHLT